jgi:hypothetical protein
MYPTHTPFPVYTPQLPFLYNSDPALGPSFRCTHSIPTPPVLSRSDTQKKQNPLPSTIITKYKNNPLTLKSERNDHRLKQRAKQIILGFISPEGIASLFAKGKNSVPPPNLNSQYSKREWDRSLAAWRRSLHSDRCERENLDPKTIPSELRNKLTLIYEYWKEIILWDKRECEELHKTIEEHILYRQKIAKNPMAPNTPSEPNEPNEPFPTISFENFVLQIYTIISLHNIFNETFLWGKGSVPVPLKWCNPLDVESSTLAEFMEKE